jgi:hypothetical protein
MPRAVNADRLQVTRGGEKKGAGNERIGKHHVEDLWSRARVASDTTAALKYALEQRQDFGSSTRRSRSDRHKHREDGGRTGSRS